MKHGRGAGRSARKRNVMGSLARARPARLDADASVRDGWPEASDIIEAAGPAESSACYLSKIRPRTPSWTGFLRPRPGRDKLIGAVLSALVTAVVLIVAVTVGPVVLSSPHPSGPVRPGHSASTGPAFAPVGPIRFRPLRLSPGWHGMVKYALRAGVVYLTGTARLSGNSQTLATLPSALRPRSELYVVASLGAAADGTIKVLPNGQLRVYGPTTHIAFVSLDGVSFPVGPG